MAKQLEDIMSVIGKYEAEGRDMIRCLANKMESHSLWQNVWQIEGGFVFYWIIFLTEYIYINLKTFNAENVSNELYFV